MNPHARATTLALLLCAAAVSAGACDAPTPTSADGAAPEANRSADASDNGDEDTSSAPLTAGAPALPSEDYRSVVDLVALRKNGALADLETVEVTTTDDPAYGTEKRLRGWPLPTLLDRFADLPDEPSGYVVQFVATDGYRATVPLEKLPADAGTVAFRDLDAPDDRRWTAFSHGDRETTPAPFYLVWPDTDADDHRPWAYKLAAIAIARADVLWGDAVPDHDSSLQPGFAVFRDHCMKCHSVNLSGGSVGPELNVPMNVTEYWRPDHLADYIRHPARYRADARMPAMDGELSDEDMTALLDYLRGMADAKICESAAECRERM